MIALFMTPRAQGAIGAPRRSARAAALGLAVAAVLTAAIPTAARAASAAVDVDAPASALAPCATIRIGLNSATSKELARLDGIGRSKAEAIVRYRDRHGPFAAIDDLRAVRGISQRIVDRNRERLTVD